MVLNGLCEVVGVVVVPVVLEKVSTPIEPFDIYVKGWFFFILSI